jgi:hypothetical protein
MLYRTLLARRDHDDEARLGLARIQAWQGSWDAAGGAFRQVLARHPHDVDARSALFDLLMWQRRWNEAQRLVDTGLDLQPRAAALLMRRARLQHWRGDETEAVKTAALAEIEAPLEPYLEEMGYRFFLGEARLIARVDAFPGGYPNQYQVGALAMQRSHKLEVAAGSYLYQRSGGADGARLVDNRYFAALNYHLGVGTQSGLSLAFGSPSHFVPRFEAKFSFLGPISRRLTGYFAYAAWLYDGGKVVHIFAPALGFAVRDDLEIDLRWWSSYVILNPPPGPQPVQDAELVHSAGLYGTYHASARVDVGLGYTYGVVLDQIPGLYQLLDLRSHIVTSYADWIVGRSFGVRPLLALERRRTGNQPAILVFSTELSIYTRW